MHIKEEEKDLEIFSNPIFGELEVLSLNGKEYFPATKVATILGYTNPRKAVRDHCIGGERFVHPIQTHGGVQNIEFIDEGNLYRLIVKSKLPQAIKFERWIFDEVLPMIRKTGGVYMGEYIFERLTNNPQELGSLLKRCGEVINELKPKAEEYDRFMNSNGSFSISTTAKMLNYQSPTRKNKGIGRNMMFEILRNLGILQQDYPNRNVPYQEYIDEGYFEVIGRNSNGKRSYSMVLVKPKGISFIMHLLDNEGYVPRNNTIIPSVYENDTVELENII